MGEKHQIISDRFITVKKQIYTDEKTRINVTFV